MPLIVISCRVTGGTPKGLGRKMPAITRASLRSSAGHWHETVLQSHFTPYNDSRYRFDPRNKVYMEEIKKNEGVGGGRYIKDLLKGQSLRWMRTFVSITATQRQAVVRMISPTYFEKPFVGTFTDPHNGKTKVVTRQPDKPGEITQVNSSDNQALIDFARSDVQLRTELALRGI